MITLLKAWTFLLFLVDLLGFFDLLNLAALITPLGNAYVMLIGLSELIFLYSELVQWNLVICLCLLVGFQNIKFFFQKFIKLFHKINVSIIFEKNIIHWHKIFISFNKFSPFVDFKLLQFFLKSINFSLNIFLPKNAFSFYFFLRNIFAFSSFINVRHVKILLIIEQIIIFQITLILLGINLGRKLLTTILIWNRLSRLWWWRI